jgi:hypothetical protein
MEDIQQGMFGLMELVKSSMNQNILFADLDTIKIPRIRAYISEKQKEILDLWEAQKEKPNKRIAEDGADAQRTKRIRK